MPKKAAGGAANKTKGISKANVTKAKTANTSKAVAENEAVSTREHNNSIPLVASDSPKVDPFLEWNGEGEVPPGLEGLSAYLTRVSDAVARQLAAVDEASAFSRTEDMTEVQAIEAFNPRDVYDSIVADIPTECISVSILLEALVRQVSVTFENETGKCFPESTYEENLLAGINTNQVAFGGVDWGIAVTQKVNNPEKCRSSGVGGQNLSATSQQVSSDPMVNGGVSETYPSLSSHPLFRAPMYLKAGDYASIRTCHLNESFATKISEYQLAGDMRNVGSFLWKKFPEFNQGLQVKLLGNLNHFLHFMPSGMIKFDDMYYVLHLLMCAGVEAYLRKLKEEKERNARSIELLQMRDSLKDEDVGISPEKYVKFPGTNLPLDRNYLAVNGKTGLHFVVSPNSNEELTVTSFGHTLAHLEDINTEETNEKGKIGEILETGQNTTRKTRNSGKGKRRRSKRRSSKKNDFFEGKADGDLNLNADKGEDEPIESKQGKINKRKTDEKLFEGEVDAPRPGDKKLSVPLEEEKEHAEHEDVEQDEVLEDALEGETPANSSKPSLVEKEIPEENNIGSQPGESHINEEASEKQGFARINYPEKITKRFVACEDAWIYDVHEFSIIQSLLECPALSSINEAGVPDISKWTDKYLLTSGLDVMARGDGDLLGRLQNWSFVEDFVPIQTVQVLNQVRQEYMSVQRMYCPFYDTIILIFHNPVPRELTTETQFQFKLNALPGLQHFLQFTMDKNRALAWVEQVESAKPLDIVGQTGVNTLLGIIPDEQWLMDPSIKFGITVDKEGPIGDYPEEQESQTDYNGKSTFYGTMEMYKSPIPSRPPSPKAASLKPPSLNNETPQENVSRGSERMEDGEMHLEPAGGSELMNQTVWKRGSSLIFSSDESRKSATSNKPRKKSGKSITSDRKRNQTSRSSAIPNRPGSVITGTAAATIPSLKIPEEINDEEEEEQVDGSTLAERLSKLKPLPPPLDFASYDLGKQVLDVNNNVVYMHPLDGSVIKYDVCTIEPDLRMMQLTVSKNGHNTYFYPYYIPPEFDLSSEDYVVCPFFHMVMSNGSTFAFQDSRAEESAPYTKIATNDKEKSEPDLFSLEKVLFGREVEMKLFEAAETVEGKEEEERGESADSKETRANWGITSSKPNEEEENEGEQSRKSRGFKGSSRPSMSKKRNSKQTEQKSSKKSAKGSETVKKEGKKGKKGKEKKGDKSKQNSIRDEVEGEQSIATENPPDFPENDSPEGEFANDGGGEIAFTPAPPPSEVDGGGTGPGGKQWTYFSSDDSDLDEEKHKRRNFFLPPWDNAVELLKPMTHELTVTLPSGLTAKVEDLPGPPLHRIVKQYYEGQGSAKSTVEGCRYYTMDGSVIKFMLGGTLQILTARGISTTIQELAANAKRDTENGCSAFGSASLVKIFNGEVILPNGHLWKVVNGKKVTNAPIFVYTTGVLNEGEIFRRRQDGVVSLHRYDGTVITHYPDGTRFTTKVVIREGTTMPKPDKEQNVQIEETTDESNSTRKSGAEDKGQGKYKDTEATKEEREVTENGESPQKPVTETSTPDEATKDDEDDEFKDWVFVGVQYMIEHPNYSTVLFNTLTGVTHLKLPCGEWVRVLANGNIRINTDDRYSIEVDPNKAVLTYPPCSKANQAIPNATAVRLWHTALEVHEEVQSEVIDDDQTKRKSVPLEVITEVAEEKEPTRPRKSDAQSARFSLHPKVKGREKSTQRAKLSSTAGTLRNDDSAFSSRPDRKTLEQEIKTAKMLRTSTIDGQGESNPMPVDEEPKPQKKARPTFSEFLEFTDELSFCKSVDSWNNHFIMNIDGSTNLERRGQKNKEACKKISCDELIETLSEYSNLSRDFIAGLLRKKSESDLEKVSKRFEAVREACTGMLPDSKIFVVKRDLSSFQFLQRDQVEDLLSKAYSSKHSMVVVDPVPNSKSRKFVTIMRPVEETGEPHGMWTRPYIEPFFRPTSVTNKHLRISSPKELRWFGYILSSTDRTVKKDQKLGMKKMSSAQTSKRKGPKPTRSKSSKKVKSVRSQLAAKTAVPPVSLASTETSLMPLLYSPGLVLTKSQERLVGSGESLEDAGEEDEDMNGTPLETDDEEEGSEEEFEGMEQDEDMEADETNIRSDMIADTVADGDNVKPTKKKKDKRDGKKSADLSRKSINPNLDKDENRVSLGEGAEEDEDEDESFLDMPQASNYETKTIADEPLQDCGIDMEDMRAVYEMEHQRRSIITLPRIVPKQHSQLHNEKKSMVVRAIVEIPKVDEDMQRALHSASLAYTETCNVQTSSYKSYRPEDPRSKDEKQKQAWYRHEMIDKNIEDMHLQEQKPGPSLKFHF